MVVAPGAYLIVIPNACKNPSAPLRRHFGRAQRDLESVTSRILGLNRFRVPLTLRVIGPGMTNGVDAHGAVRMLPNRHSGRAQRDPESVPAVRVPDKNRFRVPRAGDAYQQRPFELAEVLVGSGSFWPVLSMLRLPHLSSACTPCGVAVAV